jgi:hypothetical protein
LGGPPENHIKNTWRAIFPNEDELNFTTPVGGMIWKLVSRVMASIDLIYVSTTTTIQIVDRLASWRHNIGSSGLLVLKTKVFPILRQGGDISDITWARSEWCTWALSCTEDNHLFYFVGVIKDKDCNIQSQSVGFCAFLSFLELTHTPTFHAYQGIFQSKIILLISTEHTQQLLRTYGPWDYGPLD